MYSSSLGRLRRTAHRDLYDTRSNPDLFAVLSPQELELTAWFGTPQVTTAIHCDMFQHNFFVQLSGWKDFELWAPRDHFSLYLHSSLNSAARQSRIRSGGSLSRADAAATRNRLFPDFEKAPAKLVRLGPGDTLYIPPHWFHRVTSIGGGGGESERSALSVSLSCWTEVEAERDAVNSIRAMPVPFDVAHWDLSTLRDKARHYLLRVIGGVLAEEGSDMRDAIARDFMKRLAHSRHSVPEADCAIPGQTSTTSTVLIAREAAAADAVAKKFRDDVRSDIREIHLADYAEEIVAFVVAKKGDDGETAEEGDSAQGREGKEKKVGRFLCWVAGG